MKIAILGTGRVGATLGRRFSELGHEVFFGSREPSSDKAQEVVGQCGSTAQCSDVRSAASAAEVVILAVPWEAARQSLNAAGDLDGKVLVDCINPINASFDGLDLGYTTSASEQIAQWAEGARVVKAFNTISGATMEDPNYGDQPASMFYCGNDEPAKATVGQLAAQLGLEGIDAGGLEVARYLEPLAMLYILMAVRKGWGSSSAFKIIKR